MNRTLRRRLLAALASGLAGAAAAHPGHSTAPDLLSDLAHFLEHLIADMGPLAVAVPLALIGLALSARSRRG
jgi:hypothetical protein